MTQTRRPVGSSPLAGSVNEDDGSAFGLLVGFTIAAENSWPGLYFRTRAWSFVAEYGNIG